MHLQETIRAFGALMGWLIMGGCAYMWGLEKRRQNPRRLSIFIAGECMMLLTILRIFSLAAYQTISIPAEIGHFAALFCIVSAGIRSAEIDRR